MKYLLALLLLAQTACGENARIEVVHLTPDELHTQFGEEYLGYTRWNDQSCTIYVYYPNMYSSEHTYTFVLGHEMRHCLEGKFHGEEPAYE